MSGVHLTGQLICVTANEARIVALHLPAHVELTRAEPGCLYFNVTSTANPLVWAVAEGFESEAAFNQHQERVAASQWGGATAGIERQYAIEGVSG